MAHSRKRRQSMSPTRPEQPHDTPDHKKRKPNGAMSKGASSSKAASTSRPQVARSPGPTASDSSTTLDGDSPPTKDKGKAIEKDPLILELERLRKEVAHKNEILETREKAISAVTQTLTCQICLELMQVPYALAPCGHVSCHTCLVAWFTSPHNDAAGDEQDPEVEWFSDNESSEGGYGLWEPPAPNANGNVPVNGNPAVANPQADANPGANGVVAAPANNNPAPPAPELAPAPAPAAYPNSIHRRKTCPHCRCVVRERPVLVYAIKDLVGIIDPPTAPAKDESPKKKKDKQDKEKASQKEKENEKDPWKLIFRPPKAQAAHNLPPLGPYGGWGDEDGEDDGDDSDEDPGPWPGFGHAPGGPNPLFFADVEEQEAVHFHPPFFGQDHHLHVGANPHAAPLPAHVQPPPPAFVDEEDGVRRCGACMHELWRGECTNHDCGVVYEDASDAGSDAGPYAPEYGGARPDGDDDHEDEGEGIAWGFHDPEYEGLDGDGDDGYESSFIDDEEHRARRAQRAHGSDEEGSEGGAYLQEVQEDEDDFIPGPSRRLWSQGARMETIVVSSDEDEEEAPGPSNRTGRGRNGTRTRTRRIVDDDEEEGEEQEVEGDVHSVDDGSAVHHSVAATFGEDGSSDGSPWRDSDPGSTDRVVGQEGDDGHGYIWNEDDQDQDDVVYLHDEDADEDDGDDGDAY